MPTIDRTANLERNRQHYDAVYRYASIDALVAKVNKAESFLDYATQTCTSWHGLYHGDFRSRIRGSRVLELGCGDGFNALIMAALGAQVVAVDISPESEHVIRQAAERLQWCEERIQPMTGDFAQLTLDDGSFDWIVGKAFLHHLTVDMELEYLERVARLIKPAGEVRFVEPATNCRVLDWLRWLVPVPGRPSKLSRRAFAVWKARDPHPDRSNDSFGYVQRARRFFDDVQVIPIGSIERFHRLLPKGEFNRAFRRWAHRRNQQLPHWLQYRFARTQTLIYRNPIQPAHTLHRISEASAELVHR